MLHLHGIFVNISDGGREKNVHFVFSWFVLADDGPFEYYGGDGAKYARAQTGSHYGEDQATGSDPEVIPMNERGKQRDHNHPYEASQ